MKFLCLDCDEPMKLHSTAGPDDGSLTVTFRCPECGFRVAMLTNQFETQMVKSLGVKVGGRTAPATPFEQLRTAMANPRADAFENTGAVEQRANAPAGSTVTSAGSAETAMSGGDAESGAGCPFAAMIQQPDAAAASATVAQA